MVLAGDAADGAGTLIVPLDSGDATLESCGGKGLNLVRLTRAGFPVPPGFVVATEAYRRFVVAHDLGALIEDAVAGVDPGDAAALEAASARIRAGFEAGGVPHDIEDAVRAGWQRTFAPDTAVAVRSSATAEDLPDLSFAGQQDTFLNVLGVDAALTAMVRCWSSLWTARAIGYRARNDLAQSDVALAVVVQELVPAEVSGVMFTVNPLTGARGEVVLDATWGLGEALVSGQVEPDHVVVDTASGLITRTLGAKATVTSPSADGGVVTANRDADDRTALTDGQVRELVALGRSVAAEYGAPQDIEWAIADGAVHLVQARPITSLFPVPDGDPEALWFSFGAVQGMLQPMTPLGRDTIRILLSGVTELVGKRFDLGDAGYLKAAGERLWIRVDRILKGPLGGRLLPRVLPVLEPSAAAILVGLREKGNWAAPGRLRPSTVRGLATMASQVLPRVPLSLIDPARRRHSFDARVEELVAEAAHRQADASLVPEWGPRLAARARVMRETLLRAFPVLLRGFAPVMMPSMAMLLRTNALAADAGPRARALAMEVLRGLPGNVTTEMDLALWRTASELHRDPDARRAFADGDAAELAARYAAGTLPDTAQRAVAAFLADYGMRGVGEIDLGQPRWRENPVDVVRSLQSYLQITDPEQAPDAVFARGREAAARATEELVALVGPRRGLRFMVSRLRNLLGARETPKFTMVRLFGLIREGLLASGRDLVDAGVLERSDDVFYLHLDELERLPTEPVGPWKAVVAARREVGDRERRRRQVPRMLASDGRAFYEGLGSQDAAIVGSPVSPGVVEGPVRVVFDPQSTRLLPGEILVCPGTDPAWTPLFLSAGGLITEVGGMMTHGSVVAREYGIPAVVGVHQATSRLRTGQRIRLDGMTGSIEILDDEAADAASD